MQPQKEVGGFLAQSQRKGSRAVEVSPSAVGSSVNSLVGCLIQPLPRVVLTSLRSRSYPNREPWALGRRKVFALVWRSLPTRCSLNPSRLEYTSNNLCC